MLKKRLSKTLAAAGVASRRACEELIFSGVVEVNGKIVLQPQFLVNPKEDKISCQGRLIDKEQKKVYYILNKPVGYTSSNQRIGRKKIVLDLFEPLTTRLFLVGRLDRDTSGLLIVTNDGNFAQQVIHPSMNLSKEYIVKVKGEISHDHLRFISQGAIIDDCHVKPYKVEKIRKGTLRIVVKEGKNREVRRFIEKTDLEIRELKRVRIGNLLLGKIPEGSWREMTEKEKQLVLSKNLSQ
jgi:23S rRNA pseudouridine2605 synthase